MKLDTHSISLYPHKLQRKDTLILNSMTDLAEVAMISYGSTTYYCVSNSNFTKKG